MPSIRLKGSITEDGRLNVQGERLPLPPGEVDVIVLFSKTAASPGETQPQFTPYTVGQNATIERFLKAAGAINSGDVNSSVKVDEILYGSEP